MKKRSKLMDFCRPCNKEHTASVCLLCAKCRRSCNCKGMPARIRHLTLVDSNGHSQIYDKDLKFVDRIINTLPRTLGVEVELGTWAGKLYSSDKPFRRSILVWKFGSTWMALLGSGFNKDELVRIATTAHTLQ